MSSVIPIFIGGGEGWEDSLNFFLGGGGEGVVKKRGSPDFSSPEVGSSVTIEDHLG